MTTQPLALGLDAAGVDRSGVPRWCAVVVGPDGVVSAGIGGLVELITWADGLGPGPVAAIGVDIPIDHVDGPVRTADAATRAFVRPLSSTVFPTPPARVLDAISYAEANERLAASGAPKLSKQAWMLVPRIVEATELARLDPRLHEVHPEASFREMKIQLAAAAAPEAVADDVRITRSKKTWNGLLERRRLLAAHGIAVPEDDPALDGVMSDDVVDAAAVAWSARRIALGVACPMPDPPEWSADGRPVAVWR
ncbi:DUF429 domain-containing protein [Dermatobacter hominis]|uniref:DUF429 domain-containing protein n=1 Tax=Dermatobacter hominis TaxID=2884263 RepID=UPI001D11F093|nr:DUF429 domain-containing protein [Dermatobacter hominis]UDY35230.1 DUF429 domain-containing protein [Dermatobacter hominis]